METLLVTSEQSIQAALQRGKDLDVIQPRAVAVHLDGGLYIPDLCAKATFGEFAVAA